MTLLSFFAALCFKVHWLEKFNVKKFKLFNSRQNVVTIYFSHLNEGFKSGYLLY